MSLDEMRQEALRYAVQDFNITQSIVSTQTVLERAEAYYQFLLNGLSKSKPEKCTE